MDAQYAPAMDTDLSGIDWSQWLIKLEAVAGDDGYVEPLGPEHAAVFIEHKPILLVTFENFASLSATSAEVQPVGWQVARHFGWSHLCLASQTESWFREPRVYGYFDRLVDDGFLEEFDQVIFFGAGACGYAAAAYSVAAPGARVLTVQPQATLDPRIAEWDTRFRRQRRRDFTTRYGYAPDMLDACDRAYVIYDPEIEEDAMHAALFERRGVTRFRARFLGPRMDRSLLRMNLLTKLIHQISENTLDDKSFAHLYRARRDDIPYLKSVLGRLEDDGRLYLNACLAQHVLDKTPGPRFRRSLKAAYDKAAELGVKMPAKAE